MDTDNPPKVRPVTRRLPDNHLRGHYDNWMYFILVVVFLLALVLGLIQPFVGDVIWSIELDFYKYGVDISIDKHRVE